MALGEELKTQCGGMIKMLNGIAPVIVFVFKKEIAGFKIPFLPIPVYLDERLTGILADEHSRHMSVEVDPVGEESYEKTTSSDVQISFIAKKNNVAVTAALALFEMVMKYVNKHSERSRGHNQIANDQEDRKNPLRHRRRSRL